MRCPAPGKAVRATVVLCLLAGISDILCFLPHPQAASRYQDMRHELEGSALDLGQEMQDLTANLALLESGLPSWKVRQGYHQDLSDLEEKLGNMKRTTACAIADVAVKARSAARLKARLQGSAVMHAVLELRDLFVYGFDPFTLEKMMSMKRAKLEKAHSNESVSDDVVCSSIVGSSTRSNKAWNAAAEEGFRHAESKQRTAWRHSHAMPPTNTTPLHAACRAGDLDMVNYLLSVRADPNIKEISQCGGRTPLHLAAHANLQEIAAKLLDGGALPEMQDARGSTPLHVAALEGHPEITRLLLDSGADPRVMDYAGFNAAWWAKEFKHQSVLDIYLANEVEPEKLKVDVSKIKYKTGKKKKKDSGDKPRAKRK